MDTEARHRGGPVKAELVGQRGVIAEAARLTSLTVLGAGTAVMGALLAFTAPATGPSLRVFGLLPLWPELYGGLIFAAGMSVLIGKWTSKPRMIILGSFGAAAMYAIFAAISIWQYTAWAIGHVVGTPAPAVALIPLYIVLAALHVLHLDTERVAEEKKRRPWLWPR